MNLNAALTACGKFGDFSMSGKAADAVSAFAACNKQPCQALQSPVRVGRIMRRYDGNNISVLHVTAHESKEVALTTWSLLFDIPNSIRVKRIVGELPALISVLFPRSVGSENDNFLVLHYFPNDRYHPHPYHCALMPTPGPNDAPDDPHILHRHDLVRDDRIVGHDLDLALFSQANALDRARALKADRPDAVPLA